MIVLGIIDSKPSSAAILIDGQIISAIAEERICRMKLASGMPRAAISEVIRQAGISPTDIDFVAIAQEISVYEPHPIPWDGWFEKGAKEKTKRFDALSARLAAVVGKYPIAWKAHHQLKRFMSQDRLEKSRICCEKNMEFTPRSNSITTIIHTQLLLTLPAVSTQPWWSHWMVAVMDYQAVYIAAKMGA
jgi:predicted NodU family carbamoyl transferase